MMKHKFCAPALASLLALTAGGAFAQDNQALIDALVRKGILSQKDAEKIESEVSKNPVVSQGPTSPLKLAPWIKELKLSGDLRLRFQYDQEQRQEQQPQTSNANGVAQRNRWRFRLRLNAEMILDGGFFGGFSLATNYAADSNNQTYTGGFNNYDIFINKAFVGYNGTPGLLIEGGKFDNPFYKTDMFYDPDIYPNGATERIDLHKLLGWSDSNPFQVSFIAGQFIFWDNNEFGFNLTGGAPSSTARPVQVNQDLWLFQEQFLLRYKTKLFQVTVAPSFFIAQGGAYGENTNGIPNFGATISPQTYAQNIKADPLAFLPTQHSAGAEEQHLALLQVPGDVTFKIPGLDRFPVQFYWDFLWNADGTARASLLETAGASGQRVSSGAWIVTNAKGKTVSSGAAGTGPFGFFSDFNLNQKTGVGDFSNRVGANTEDKFAWLIGVKIGQNKKAGDLSVYVDYRRVGFAATDPNLANDDMNNGRLNFQGFHAGIVYNITDFLTFGVDGVADWQLRNIYGGQLTRGSGIADDNTWNYIRADLILNF
ncbi:MAG: putative porin [Verrucomicrobia bacterium]|nr:putative porin [Verrucomicrobiota bacterium]